MLLSKKDNTYSNEFAMHLLDALKILSTHSYTTKNDIHERKFHPMAHILCYGNDSPNTHTHEHLESGMSLMP